MGMVCIFLTLSNMRDKEEGQDRVLQCGQILLTDDREAHHLANIQKVLELHDK